MPRSSPAIAPLPRPERNGSRGMHTTITTTEIFLIAMGIIFTVTVPMVAPKLRRMFETISRAA